MTEPLLDIRGLKTHFATDDGIVHAVDGVDLAIDRGETVGVVGESGCGKTITAMSVLKLIPMPPGRIVAGQILWKGRDLVPLDADAMRKIRSKEIAMVFQEPMTSLNPVYHDRRPDRRGDPPPRGAVAPRRPRQDRRDAAPRQHPQSRAARARLPAPVLRRHAPAGDDRHGALLRPAAPHRRRADDRPRRHHPGADPRSPQRPEGAPRHGHHADHPRHGRGRRDGAARRRHVRRQGGRGGDRRASSSPSRSTPTRRASSARSRASTGRRRTRRASRRSPASCRASSIRRPAAGFRPAAASRAPPASAATPPLVEVTPGHKVACVLHEASRGLAA